MAKNLTRWILIALVLGILTGWATNAKLVLPSAGTYYLDIAFQREIGKP